MSIFMLKPVQLGTVLECLILSILFCICDVISADIIQSIQSQSQFLLARFYIAAEVTRSPWDGIERWTIEAMIIIRNLSL